MALLVVVSFLAVSSGISYTGGISSETETRDFEPVTVYECPENECPDRSYVEETIEGCRDVLKTYEEKVRDLETEKSILQQRMEMFLEDKCEIGGGGDSMEEAASVADPESVREFAVFLVSNSEKDPITSLYEYVRMNVMCVGDPGKEYIASPCETIILGGGDCEDHSILLASLLEGIGIESVIIWIPGEHAVVGIRTGGKKVQGLCDDALWFEHKGENLLIADTVSSNCVGRTDGKYLDLREDGWDWKTDPVIFEI